MTSSTTPDTDLSLKTRLIALVVAVTFFMENLDATVIATALPTMAAAFGVTPVDMNMMEQTLSFQGLYYVLMGRISPLDGVGPRELGLERLMSRVLDGEVREVILATNYTNEGEATAHYITAMLKPKGITVTRIARGVPVGGELEYVDSGTLAQALRERKAFAG